MIVEDDRSARRAVAAILTRQGFAVSEVGTVAEALGALVVRPQLPPPDWILLDLMLPDGCGIDVIRRAQHEHVPSKICVITGCCAELLEEARTAGVAHAFTKPLDVKRLMAALCA